jgi:Amt family ammonium transporter
VSLASKAVNSAVTDQGLIFGETTLFIHQLTMIIVSIFAFSASYFLFFVNKITPLVSEDKEELGLDISQHGEFYNSKFIKNL